MRDLFIGEWRKVNGNRLTTFAFIWVAPAVALVIMGFYIIAVLSSDSLRATLTNRIMPPWNDAFLSGWYLVNNDVGRYAIAAYAAIIFAGEYQFGTWKNFVPYRRRTTLLLTKFAVLAALVTLSWVLMTVIVGAGTVLLGQVVGAQSFTPFNGETLRVFLGDYALQMALTLTTTLIAVSYAALASMFTRSTIASFAVAFVLNFIESSFLFALLLVKQVLNIDLTAAYAYIPSYNLQNIQQLIQTGTPVTVFTPLDITIPQHTLEVSIVLVVAWVAALLGLTLWKFNQQDITT